MWFVINSWNNLIFSYFQNGYIFLFFITNNASCSHSVVKIWLLLVLIWKLNIFSFLGLLVVHNVKRTISQLKNYFTTWKMAPAENLAVSAVERHKYFLSWCDIYGEKKTRKGRNLQQPDWLH